ncbi:MAG: GNAT family N-acetyltransferase [bacterium]|nr:GNAT family N-acetyltransferase [bacterium]
MAINQKYIVKQENFDTLSSIRQNSKHPLKWGCLFVLPEWLEVWWTAFGNDAKLNILSVGQQGEILGLAPLQVKGNSASFIGGTNVCDYLDFIVTADKEPVFFKALLDHLDHQGIEHLDLCLLRPDSTVLSNLVNVAENRGCEIMTGNEDISLELNLPATWEKYLSMLKGKQRHEVKRKFRRLYEAGDVTFRIVEDPKEISEQLPTFFDLFKLSSDEKAHFMTDQMISFFRALAIALAKPKILRLYILELNAVPVAVSMCFDFNGALHLYNSGFDPRFRALSVGLLCKVLSIKDAIKNGRKKYDFLKGAETYKYRLGGREVPLAGCRIDL